MNNIETAYKCRMIKEWCSEMSKKGRFFNFKIVYDIDRKIEKNWVLTEKQHNAIQNIYKKFKIDKWCIKKNQIKQYDSDSGDDYTWRENVGDDDDRIFTHKKDMRDYYFNPRFHRK